MAANTLSTLNGNTKKIYGRLNNAIPEMDVVLDLFPWNQGHLVGDRFEELVVLANENGISALGSTGASATLRTPSAMTTQPAYVTPSEYYARPQITYATAARANAKGPKAFAKAITLVANNGRESLARRVGIACLYGQATEGVGQVAAAGITDVSATTQWWNFADAQWAPGIWAGSEGAELQAYGGSGGTTLAESGGSSLFTVTKVDFAGKRILVTATSGLITAHETDNDSYAFNVVFYGSRTNDFVGAQVVFGNATSTVFGISADTYGNWSGNAYSVGSVNLTLDHILDGMSRVQARGAPGDLKLLVSHATFAKLNLEQSALRQYDSSFGAKGKTGFKGLEFANGQGNVEILASRFVKGGDGFMFPSSGVCERLGSEESEWALPGSTTEDPWNPIADTNAAEMRIRADQAFFCRMPSHCLYYSGISNS